MRKILLFLLLSLPLAGMAQKLQLQALKAQVKNMPLNAAALPQTTDIGGLTSTDTVITTPPSGTKHTYYMDRLVYDGNFGENVDQYLTPVTMTFCDNNDVYIPNMVRDDFTDEAYGRVYIKGKLSLDGKKITLSNAQKLFERNGSILRLCVPDDQGLAGDTVTKKFYTTQIVLNIDDNGVISPASGSQILGLYPDGDPGTLYGYTSIIRYQPKESVDSKTTNMQYDYVYTSNNNAKQSSIVTKYVDGNGNIYIKGFVNKYPDAWVNLIPYRKDSVALLSYQVLDDSYALGHTLLFAAMKTKTDAGTDTIGAVRGMFLVEDSITGVIKSTDGYLITTAYVDNNYNPQFPQQYESLVFTPTTISAVKPATPASLQYRKGYYTYIRVELPETDADGNALNLSNAYYRIYINGKPYTFDKATYTKLKSDTDLELIPWTYDDYDVISKSGTTRYIYFEGLDMDTVKTIGIETVYIVNGVETASDRLVYDMSTQKTSVITGIAAISARGSENVRPVAVYSVNGSRRNGLEKGFNIVRLSDGTTRKVIR